AGMESIVHEDVNLSEGLARLFHKAKAVRLLGDIGPHAEHAAAERLEFFLQALETRFVAGRDREVGSLASEGKRRVATQPGSNAGNNGDLPAEQHLSPFSGSPPRHRRSSTSPRQRRPDRSTATPRLRRSPRGGLGALPAARRGSASRFVDPCP